MEGNQTTYKRMQLVSRTHPSSHGSLMSLSALSRNSSLRTNSPARMPAFSFSRPFVVALSFLISCRPQMAPKGPTVWLP